jgi:hypothetical protein
MFLKREHNSFYQNYGSKIFEQGPAVLSDDLNARLKGYLDNDELLKKLAESLSKFDDGEYELSDINKSEFGIKDEDRLFVKVDKDNKKSPKFMMWIMNDEFLWGDLDMEAAAAILKGGGEGTSFAEKGIIGAIGSFFSGGGEDSGTDEDTIAALAGAFAKIAAEKSIDPEIYFDKLDEVFKAKYGQNIKDFLENEFSGYGEVVALNTYRRKIEPSIWRGLNPWTLLGDVALTIVTFGGSAAFTAGLKGAQVANAASKAGKLAKASGAASASAALGKGVKAVADITQLSKVFAKLDKVRKVSALEKAGITVGKEVPFATRTGTGSTRIMRIDSFADDGVQMSYKASSGNWIKNPSPTGWSNVITQLSPKTATSVVTAAGINLTTKGLIAARGVGAIDRAQQDTPAGSEPGLGAKAAEVMGYYDTLAADPKAYIENAKQQGASDVASMLLDLKNGSGLFGNTTSQEECSIALLITGLTPEMAKEVSAEYKKIDVKSDAYGVIDDELGGDISIFTKAYWTACTGEGDEYSATIANVYSRIKKGAAKS